eukprot:jgi/Picsp_1/1090/NSC_04573-R1_propionyl- alpha subunit
MWACRANRGAYSVFGRISGWSFVRSIECSSVEGLTTASKRCEAVQGTQFTSVENLSYTASTSQRDDDSKHGDTPLFEKILVANRGEIAVRVMKTAKKMGIKTVAVFSDADYNAKHKRYADEAVYLGGSASRSSYLDIHKILEAMKKSGATAVHPGYGFLSENAEFVQEVEKNGYTFIGPPSTAVGLMGDKAHSKAIAHKAGVHTIPGWIGIVKNLHHATNIAKDIGYPVMVKASGGGGGKGMRIAYNEEELIESFKVATDEAASSFGDSRMLIEKYIEKPRHIEIQIVGDKYGNMVYLPERECSIQRRNQKVIEEAPSPVGNDNLRKAMGTQAINLAKAVGYYSAGTCEFLVDKDFNFYFLEMNTRLQVEHAITEAVTGLDLVEEMIRIAADKKFDYRQDEVSTPKGWAIECRIYAEDPAVGYLPSTGFLKRYQEPLNARIDTGVEEGAEISIWYDPLISKVITHGPDRATALSRAAEALDNYVIHGVRHNIPLLRNCLETKEFAEGRTSTYFLKEHFSDPHSLDPLCLPLSMEKHKELLLIAAAMYTWNNLWIANMKNLHDFGQQSEWRISINPNQGEGMQVKIQRAPDSILYSRNNGEQNGNFIPLELETEDSIVIAEPLEASTGQSPLSSIMLNGRKLTYQTIKNNNRHLHLQYCGSQRILVIDPAESRDLASIMPPPRLFDTSAVVVSPMPGVVVDIRKSKGDKINIGDDLAVIEAMKMQNIIKSKRKGTLESIDVTVGDHISSDQVIMKFNVD